MAQSPIQSTLDGPQVLQNTHHQQLGVLKVMPGFLAGKIGRKIQRTIMSATVDRYEYIDPGNPSFTLEVTYDNSTHDNVNTVERIS